MSPSLLNYSHQQEIEMDRPPDRSKSQWKRSTRLEQWQSYKDLKAYVDLLEGSNNNKVKIVNAEEYTPSDYDIGD